MIDTVDAVRFVKNLPWPANVERPIVRMYRGVTNAGDPIFVALLHRNVRLGWADVAKEAADTPEAALARALGVWIQRKGSNDPTLAAAVKRLSN